MKDKTVLDHLIADAGIAAMVGENYFTTQLAQKSGFPAITCEYLSSDPDNDLAGETDYDNQTITVSAWARDLAGLVTLRNAIYERMKVPWAVRLNMVELHDPEQKIYRYAMDYSIWAD